ncbi:hypothetical protein ABC733_00435 [Mangrovibacter sp. SLW1]
MAEAMLPPLAAEARRLTLAGEWQAACEKLRQLISEVTGVQALDIVINQDQYSLNSLNGRVTLADGRSLFLNTTMKKVKTKLSLSITGQHYYVTTVLLWMCHCMPAVNLGGKSCSTHCVMTAGWLMCATTSRRGIAAPKPWRR